MKKVIIAILLFSSICYGDIFDSHLTPRTDSSLDIGSAILLWRFIYGDAFTDGTALWADSELSGFTSIEGTTLTDGTFIVSGGEISAGEIINTFGDIDIGGNAVTARNLYVWGGTSEMHTTHDPQLSLIHTGGVDYAEFYVNSFGDLRINATGGDISFDNEDLTTTGLFNAMRLRELPDGNICIGDDAGLIGQTGDYNIFLGDDVGSSTTTANYNVFLGHYVGDSVTTGGHNVGIGYGALNSLTIGDENTAIGYLAGDNATGSRNVFLGHYTGIFETGDDTLLIDDRLRANEATGRARALLYGTFADAAADQMLRINGDFTVHGDDVWVQPITDSTHLFQIFDADAGAPIFAVDSTNERIGIGMVNPGDTGYAKLQINGTDVSAAGPHVSFEVDLDTFPTMQFLNWTHDSVTVAFDAYYDGVWRSSDAGSNARIWKSSDLLRFRYDNGIPQGDVVPFHDGIVLDLTDGDVGINTATPDATLQVVGDTILGADTVDYTKFTTRGAMEMHGDARVYRHMVIGAASWKIGAGAPTASFENIYPTLLFADGRDDAAHYGTWVPYRWDNTTDMTVAIHWRHDTVAKTGKVLWNLNYIGATEGEDPAGAGTLISQLSAGNHPQDEIIVTTFGTNILAANLERMDDLGLKLWRNGDDGTDLLTEGAELITMHIHFTMNQLGDPMLTPVTDVLLLDDGASKLLLDDGASFLLIRI